MRRGKGPMPVEEYRHHQIYLDRDTSKFTVEEATEAFDTLQAARNGIDRLITGNNKGVRRKIVFLQEHDSWQDEEKGPPTIEEGELTSWKRVRYGRKVEGIVMYGDSRTDMSPDDIFEDTEEIRGDLRAVIEYDRQILDLQDRREKLLKGIPRAAMPKHFSDLLEKD